MKRTVTIAVCSGQSDAAGVDVRADAAASAPPDLSRLVPGRTVALSRSQGFRHAAERLERLRREAGVARSDNFQVFSRSRLYLKLQQAQTEFAAAAGVPPDMDLLANVAGSQSALAIYDIGNLEFLYITRLSSDRFAGGALWKTRGQLSTPAILGHRLLRQNRSGLETSGGVRRGERLRRSWPRAKMCWRARCR